MMQIMNAITDKLEWDRKVSISRNVLLKMLTRFQVFDEEIASKWRTEVLDSGRDVTPKMMDWVIAELRYKARLFQETGTVSAFDAGVVKSDTAIPDELKHALQTAVRPLEDIPAEQKDYHPGSDMKVVDLVHPSLFPVIYGRTRILKDKVIGLEDCLAHAGSGEVLPVPPEDEAGISHLHFRPFSRKFQWLPCDVQFTDGDECRIVSYINNLHPVQNRDLYGVIEKILARTIPLWNSTLTAMRRPEPNRITYKDVDYMTPEPQPDDNEEWDSPEFEKRYDEWLESRQLKLPEPGKFEPEHMKTEDWKVDLRKEFREKGLQVIVKLANIELTPEKPEYEGGSWHVEGQLASPLSPRPLPAMFN